MIAFDAETINQASTGSYASILKAKLGGLYASIVVLNLDAVKDLKYKVLLSNDPDGASASYGEDKAETTIQESATGFHITTIPSHWVDVQIKEASALESPHASCWLIGVAK